MYGSTIEVSAATWEERAEHWRIETNAGALTAEILVAGPGPLSAPKLPDIQGIGTFKGMIFHSAQWNHEHPLDGERVAVIGTGASSIQLVPHLQPQVAKLYLTSARRRGSSRTATARHRAGSARYTASSRPRSGSCARSCTPRASCSCSR